MSLAGGGAPARWQPSPWVLERRDRNSALADVDSQHFFVQTFDPGDEETPRLLAEAVAPHVRVAAPVAER